MTPAQSALNEAADYLAAVAQDNPHLKAEKYMERPDVGAALNEALGSAKEDVLASVEDAWSRGGGPGDSSMHQHLLTDVQRVFSSLPHLKKVVQQAYASVRGSTKEDAVRRGEAIRRALLTWAQETDLLSVQAASTSRMASATAAVLAVGAARAAAGEKVMKTWIARVDKPSCCMWCRALHGTTVGLNEEFPHGAPVRLPHQRLRHVATPAGARRFGQSIGSPILYTRPPAVYRGVLLGPPRHPRCECRIELSRDNVGKLAPPGPGYVSAAEIRAMPEHKFRALRSFLLAAVHELGQQVRRMVAEIRKNV